MSEDLGKVSIELTLDGPRTEKLLESVLASASPLAKQTIADRVIMQVVESVDLEKVALGGVTAFLASAAATDEMIQKAAKKATKGIESAESFAGMCADAAKQAVQAVTAKVGGRLESGMEKIILDPSGPMYVETQKIILDELRAMVRKCLKAVRPEKLRQTIDEVAADEQVAAGRDAPAPKKQKRLAVTTEADDNDDGEEEWKDDESDNFDEGKERATFLG